MSNSTPSHYRHNPIRDLFPIFQRNINNYPLIYLDSAASTQKPASVIDCLSDFQRQSYANTHRGLYTLGQESTTAFEDARNTVAQFIGASPSEIIFVRGTTEAMNLLAHSFAAPRLQAGDRIVITAMEHHANIVPWQLLSQSRQIALDVVNLLPSGDLDLADLESKLTPSTKLLSVMHVSNALGTINPVQEIIAMAHQRHIPVIVDGAQAVSHLPINVRQLDCDFYAFSGHKLFAPTGIGVLYGKAHLLEQMPPYQGGGEMIESVSFAGTTFKPPPARFEAGTPDFMGAIGLRAAIDFFTGLDQHNLHQLEQCLLLEATTELEKIPGLRLIGTAMNKIPIVSFVIDGLHPHDVATLLDRRGIAVRAGHHCAQPLMQTLGVPATLRVSFSIYNDQRDIVALIDGLHTAVKLLR